MLENIHDHDVYVTGETGLLSRFHGTEMPQGKGVGKRQGRVTTVQGRDWRWMAFMEQGTSADWVTKKPPPPRRSPWAH